MTAENASEVLAAWETSSQYWNKHQALIEQMYASLSRALIEEAGISEGQSVLDIGGGNGEASFEIDSGGGESGVVAYTRPTAGMVEDAREESKKKGRNKNWVFQSEVEEK